MTDTVTPRTPGKSEPLSTAAVALRQAGKTDSAWTAAISDASSRFEETSLKANVVALAAATLVTFYDADRRIEDRPVCGFDPAKFRPDFVTSRNTPTESETAAARYRAERQRRKAEAFAKRNKCGTP